MDHQPTSELVVFYLLWHATERGKLYSKQTEVIQLLHAYGVSRPHQLLEAGIAFGCIQCLPHTLEHAAQVVWLPNATLSLESPLPMSDLWVKHAALEASASPGLSAPIPGAPLPEPLPVQPGQHAKATALMSYYRPGAGHAAAITLAQWHQLITAPSALVQDLSKLLALYPDAWRHLEECLDSVEVAGLVVPSAQPPRQYSQYSGLAAVFIQLDGNQLKWQDAWRVLLFDQRLEQELLLLSTWPSGRGLLAVIDLAPDCPPPTEGVVRFQEYIHGRPEFAGLRCSTPHMYEGKGIEPCVWADPHAYLHPALCPAKLGELR